MCCYSRYASRSVSLLQVVVAPIIISNLQQQNTNSIIFSMKDIYIKVTFSPNTSGNGCGYCDGGGRGTHANLTH